MPYSPAEIAAKTKEPATPVQDSLVEVAPAEIAAKTKEPATPVRDSPAEVAPAEIAAKRKKPATRVRVQPAKKPRQQKQAKKPQQKPSKAKTSKQAKKHQQKPSKAKNSAKNSKATPKTLKETKKTAVAPPLAMDLTCHAVCNHRDLASFQVWDNSYYKASYLATKKNIPLMCCGSSSGVACRKFYTGSDYGSVNPEEFIKVTKQRPIHVCPNSVNESHPCLYALCDAHHSWKVIELSNDKGNEMKRSRKQTNVILPGEVSRGGFTYAS